LADEARGLAEAWVETAIPLTSDQEQRLRAALERMTGKMVEMHMRMEPEVLAGVRVRIGDHLIDGSAAGRLQAMRSATQGTGESA
jgi:F-type H+-transporting ATPase subunit delta